MSDTGQQNQSTEQLSEGPGNGGIAKSVSGKTGIKRKSEHKSLDVKYNAIMEFEKGQKSKSEIAKMFNIPKNTLTGWINKTESIKQGWMKFGPKRRNMREVCKRTVKNFIKKNMFNIYRVLASFEKVNFLYHKDLINV